MDFSTAISSSLRSLSILKSAGEIVGDCDLPDLPEIIGAEFSCTVGTAEAAGTEFTRPDNGLSETIAALGKSGFELSGSRAGGLF